MVSRCGGVSTPKGCEAPVAQARGGARYGACGGRGGGVRDAGGPCGGAGVLALSGVTGDGAALEEEPLSHPAEGQEGSACVVPTEILKGSVLWVRQHHRREGGGGLDGGGDDGGAWRQFDPGG